MLTKHTPGETFDVKVNGRPFVTVIDPEGTQRFKVNQAVYFMKEGTHAVAENSRTMGLSAPLGNVGLSELYVLFENGKISLNDYIDFYAMIGYSICGFMELFGAIGVTIDNPLE